MNGFAAKVSRIPICTAKKTIRNVALGFLALRCGIVAGWLLEQGTPSLIYNIESILPVEMECLLTGDRSTDSSVANELMVINDTPVGAVAKVSLHDLSHADFVITSEEMREATIAAILAQHGINVEFVD